MPPYIFKKQQKKQHTIPPDNNYLFSFTLSILVELETWIITSSPQESRNTTAYAPSLLTSFFTAYESDFLDNMIRSGHRKLARSFNLCFRYIDDLIVFNNKKFWGYVKDIYPSQLNVEKTNQSDNLASYLDLTFTTEKDGNFLLSYMTNVMTLIFILSIFHSCQAIYHLTLLMVFTSRSH